eukprot:CAMPEP_0202691744 /NCGR_PEP_ID=MMETSP1385-20130828/6378_1 /ASSEMBLY_ACC=CAM_ASM_000861 /TAXON_ID=933848 /ORGANISM="Elphidium margaritaceum" /LENGTH=194 /DNA_ID=CAMNT_0049347191 /DNA_START=36 /DNA_END=620 /DNA_ORIENTATION=+
MAYQQPQYVQPHEQVIIDQLLIFGYERNKIVQALTQMPNASKDINAVLEYLNGESEQQVIYVDQNGNPIQSQQQPQQLVYAQQPGAAPVKRTSSNSAFVQSIFGNSLKHVKDEKKKMKGDMKVKGDVKSLGKEVDGAFNSFFGMQKKKSAGQQAPVQQPQVVYVQQQPQVIYVQQVQQQPRIVYVQQQHQPGLM